MNKKKNYTKTKTAKNTVVKKISNAPSVHNDLNYNLTEVQNGLLNKLNGVLCSQHKFKQAGRKIMVLCL